MQPGEVAELRDATQARLASFRKYEALMAERMARPDAAEQEGHGVDVIHMTQLRRQIAVLEAAMARQWPSASAGSLTADQADAATGRRRQGPAAPLQAPHHAFCGTAARVCAAGCWRRHRA